MSVELDPPELGFRRPFSHEVTQVLKLTNPNSDPVAFKVKTTAPKQYCVRPNSGAIEPGKSVEVQVLLQAMKEDPPMDARCRDKFLVQSVAIDAEQAKNEANVWANLDRIAKDSIKEKKIRVSFLPARGEEGSATSTNGTSHANDVAPPAYAPPSPPSAAQSPTSIAAPQTARDFSTPSKSSGAPESQYAAAGIAAAASGATAGALSGSHSTTSANSGAPITEKAADLYNSAAQSLANTASATSETVQQQLDNAKETIVSLKEQIQSQNLRQRQNAASSGTDIKSASGASSSGLATQHATTSEGVPVQIVAALCLLSFLVAYLFF